MKKCKRENCDNEVATKDNIYCSRSCARKEQIPPMLGKYHSDETKRKISDSGEKSMTSEKRNRISEALKGNDNPWKGDDAGIRAMHVWVVLHRGKASSHNCIDCGETASDWSNCDHSYRRVLDDYLSRCVSCHRKYDKLL